jgi:zinc/manganese transport system substrate-binding protein
MRIEVTNMGNSFCLKSRLYGFFIFSFLTLTSVPLYSKISIVTTTTNIKYIAEQIGKDNVEVYSMIRGFDDPHFVMTRPDFLVKLSNADILCVIGLDLETGWIPLLLNQSRNMKIQKGQIGYCDTSVGIKVLGEPTMMLDRSMGDMHIYGNPHYWLDPVNAIQMSANILASLKRVDPVNSNYYEGNYKDFKQRLINLIKEETKKFEPYFNSRVAVFHDQFVYLANRFKFTANLTLEERPGVPPSSRYLEQVISNMISQDIKVILISPYHNISYAQFVSSKVPGSKVLVIPESIGAFESIKTYEQIISESLKLIRDALESK